MILELLPQRQHLPMISATHPLGTVEKKPLVTFLKQELERHLNPNYPQSSIKISVILKGMQMD